MTTPLTMEKDSISISFVREVLDCVRRRGLQTDAVLQAAGISPDLLASEQSRVSAASFSALWLGVAALLDDELFGLDARRMKVGSFANLCYFTVASKNLRTALLRAAKFIDIVLDDVEIAVREDGAQAGLLLLTTPRASAAGRAPEPLEHETLLIMLHGLMCWLIGRRIAIVEARFAYPAPLRWPEYTVMYSQQLSFGQEATAIWFDAAVLDCTVTQTEDSAKDFLRAAPYNIVLKYKDANSWSARVRHELRHTEVPAWPRFDLLADTLGIAPSALRRKLEAEGGSFRSIRDALRRDMAIERLSHSTLPVADIANTLGFAEPSAFRRAFKQWTGVQPRAYRPSA